MKYFFFVLMLTVFVNCNTASNNKESSIKKSTTKLETFVRAFLDSNKNWNQNDIIRDKTNKEFKKQVQLALQQGVLDDFPLELGEINEYSKGKFAAVFESHYIKNTVDYSSILYGVKFDVIGLVDEKLIPSLIKNKAYLIKGKFKRFLGSEFQDYINGMVYTPLIGFSNDALGPETGIGVILMEIDKVTETEKL